MDYRNADGSIAEMCGNGVRVFARYLLEHGLAAGPSFAVATRSGIRQVRAEPDGQITVDMGPVTVLGPGRAVIGGVIRDGLRVSVGNPHLACLVDDALDKFDLAAPPGLDPADFPDGGNVELVRRTGPDAISMRVHERGSGETRSCGTGAVAAAAAAAALSSATKTAPRQWHVTVPGGELLVTLEAGTSWLTGPAVIVAEGELDPDWLSGPLVGDAGGSGDRVAGPGAAGQLGHRQRRAATRPAPRRCAPWRADSADPAAAIAALICRLQPGLAEMTSGAPVASTEAALRAPSSPAASGWSRLYTPAEPQQVPGSDGSTSSSPGISRSRSRGWRRMPCACPR